MNRSSEMFNAILVLFNAVMNSGSKATGSPKFVHCDYLTASIPFPKKKYAIANASMTKPTTSAVSLNPYMDAI